MGEEVGKVLIGLYLTYLILFEIQSVATSYSEDNYLATKRAAN
jgi:hypothetical protein